MSLTTVLKAPLSLRSTALAACVLVAACGGGGGGSNAVAPLGSSSVAVAAETNGAAESSTPNVAVADASAAAGDADLNDVINAARIDTQFDSASVAPAFTGDPQNLSATIDTQMSAQATGAACETLPPMPAMPSNYRSVTEFGARPNDETDDADAIQRAVDALQPGQALVFPAGRYIQSKAIWVRVPGAVLWSQGATLHATNPSNQAILLAASGASIYNFDLTAVTDVRRAAPWESRIAIFADVRNTTTSKNNIIRRNRIQAPGAPGTPTANGSSSAGIFLYQAENFLVAENEVYKTLADGIHITHGSNNGRVFNNKVRATGDDMIAMVSQLAPDFVSATAATYGAEFTQRYNANMVHDIVVAGNSVAGNYWGRGISVVGGRNVTIRDNAIADTTHAAGIYLAREPSYTTFGVHNILVKNNGIYRTQTTKPAYDPFNKYNTTLQGGIEIYSQVFDDELAIPALANELRVDHVRIEGNTIDGVINNGIRGNIGVKEGVRTMTGKNSAGQTVNRTYRTVLVDQVDVRNNKMYNVGIGPALRFLGNLPAPVTVNCLGNTWSGTATTHAICTTTATVQVTGAALTCS